MAKKKQIIENSVETLKNAIIKGIQEKKGNNIVVLNLKKLENSVCDYFIVCNADSGTQVEAIADSVHIEVKKATGENPTHSEGFANLEWILLDYFNIVVHIFKTETRQFYNIEKLWADAELEDVKEIEEPKIKKAVKEPKVEKATKVAKAEKVIKLTKVEKPEKKVKEAKATKSLKEAKPKKK